METTLVLIVEDDLVDRMACRRTLAGSQAGRFRLIEADDGAHGLQMAIDFCPDCILLDHRLPDLSGFEFLACLGAHEDERIRAIPVLMLTGADSAAVAAEAMRRGARDYLVKDAEGRYLELVPAAIERVQREQRLLLEKRRAEAKFRTLVEQTQAISYIVSENFPDRLDYVSPQIAMLGYTAAEWVGDPGLYPACMLPEDRDMLLAEISRCRQRRQPLRLEYRLRARGGEVLWLRDQADAVYDETGQPLFMQGTLVDITANKTAEQKLAQTRDELRHLAAHQERIREGERQRIAREIHDELGGLLTGIKAYVSVLAERRKQEGKPVDPLFDDTSALAQEAIDTVRRVIADLRPSVLDQLGIWAALEWYTAQVGLRSKLRSSCEIAPAASKLAMDPERSIMLFRIVQEAMTNIQRHASASTVRVRVQVENAELAVAVEDDGCGMATGMPAATSSWGILGMQERSRRLGGELTVGPRAGGGTIVMLRVPLEDSHVP